MTGSVVSSNPLQTGEVTITITNTLFGQSNLGVIDEDVTSRNFTAAPDMAGLVTSLLQNVTIGLMSGNASDAILSTTCVQALPYAADAAAALLAALIGLSALWANQTSVNTNFTAMIEVTRNSALDAVPGKDPASVRLRYGLVNDGGEERMAFDRLREFGNHPLALKNETAWNQRICVKRFFSGGGECKNLV
ncbi:hypothetical protein K438DRAFT_1754918 [Mycena galopus ATCC 62051]|nr:hypothetical protein K438DRAFT_1754918 [Mycena galopus ATCC 62051]